MAKIVVDGVEYEVDAGNNLLQECLSQGLDLPYFCWHPCMGSVGACRQCAVKQYKNADDEQGMLVMACMTPAADGSIVSIKDPQAVQMRERVIESLMINHPHDCPVCEEGGECHLQDMTLMSGHNYRRYDKKKRTHHNQYLGPFINHEMNRCIACYRCVRYYDDYAGGTDLAAMASHNHVYFGRHQEGTLESEFSGNLVEVCPTGVFTDQVFSDHYTRKWDLQTAPSVCTGCSVGCNITPGERYGSLRRIVNRYNHEINGYFICDRGRFGFEHINSKERFQEAVQQQGGESTALSVEQGRQLVQEFAAQGAIGIGSPRASNENNFALRTLVGDDRFYAGVGAAEQAINQLILQLNRDQDFHAASIRDIEQCDAVLILGEDVTNVAPRVALAVRQAVHNKARQLAEANNIPAWQDAAVRELAQHERSPLAILHTHATRLDDVATERLVAGQRELAQAAFAVANALHDEAPVSNLPEELQTAARAIASLFASARRPLIIAGSSSGSEALIKAAANIARALRKRGEAPVDICLLTPEVNSVGLSLLSSPDNSIDAALEAIESGQVKRAIVVENDLYRRAPTARVNDALAKLESLLVIDQLPTATTARADYVLPATAFAEQESTYVNYEGRAQLSFQVYRNSSAAQPAWRWLTAEPDMKIDQLVDQCAEQLKVFDRLDDLLPDLSQLVAGMKVPRQSHRYSGRTAMLANVNVHEPKQAVDDESVLSFSMEGLSPLKDSSVLGASWSPGWNSNQSISKFQEEINGHLKQEHCGELLLTDKQSPAAFFPPEIDPVEDDGLEVNLAYQIFGSEELSARSPAIRQRMTDAYIGLSPQDAQSLGVNQGQALSLNGNGMIAAACIRDQIKPGTVAVYCGDELNPHDLGSSLSLSKSEAELQRGIAGLIVSDLHEEGY
ncbi:MAG: NADH-quinone oxidoreductase subunit NuoG [Pseudohongiellaceae bacterium]